MFCKASCIDFLVENQQNAYPEFDDVRENFFVGWDGTIYEGRGFKNEGQTTFASQTSYNNKAVSISFIMRVNGTTPSLKQQESFCRFINQSIEQKDLNESFSLFHHSHLISSAIEPYDDDFVIETCNLHPRERKKLQYMLMNFGDKLFLHHKYSHLFKLRTS